jgi:hypothetical protein
MLNAKDSLDDAVSKLFAVAERFEGTPLSEEIHEAVLDIQNAAVTQGIVLDSVADWTAGS